MEVPSGESLGDIIRSTQFDESTAFVAFYQLLSVLSAIHDQKIVFKDIRPENIFVDSEGNARLGDFGIAKILEVEGNLEKMIEYSGDYGAPEFLEKGKYDYKFDIFSLGVVVYQMLTGGVPFKCPEQKMQGEMISLPSTINHQPIPQRHHHFNARPGQKKRPATTKNLRVLDKEYGTIQKGVA